MASKTETKSVPIKRTKGRTESGGRLMQPFEDMDQLFDRFMDRVYPRGFRLTPRWEWPELPQPFAGKRPNVDVIDRDDEILVCRSRRVLFGDIPRGFRQRSPRGHGLRFALRHDAGGR